MPKPERELNANRALDGAVDTDAPQAQSAETPDDSPAGSGSARAESVASNKAGAESIAQSRFDVTRPVMLVWVTVVLLALGFVLFGEVTTYPLDEEEGTIVERTMGVAEVWGLLRDDLPDVGQPALAEAVFHGAILLIVAGTLWALLLALGTRPAPAANRPGTGSHESTDLTATVGRASEPR